MKKKFDLQSEKILKICLPLIISLISLLIIVPKLPEKYFYDSYEILKIMFGLNSYYNDGSYMFTAHFFNLLNFFKFTTFEQWNVLLTFIGIVLFTVFLNKFGKIKIHLWLFIILTLVFSNIYIFRVSKEFIQFLIWGLLFLIILSKIKSTKTKNVLIIIILMIEGYVFRHYYYIIALLYFIFLVLYSNREKINIKKTILILLLLLFIGVFATSIINPYIYNRLITLRFSINYNRQDSLDAVTIINDIFSNNSAIFYSLNYIINFVRICFPIELIAKGMKYIPFTIYQIYLILSIIHSIKKHFNKSNYSFNCMVILFFSFLFVSTLYEPDFGSLIRHECCLSFIYLGIILFGNIKIKERKR